MFFDFYRLGGESAERQLRALERHEQSIITSSQIQMEFLKNRQKVIVDNLKQFQNPNRVSVPRLMSDAKASEMLARHIENATVKFKEIRKKIELVLSQPSRHDPVYQVLMRIFDVSSPFNLTRTDKTRFTIRNLAKKRFLLGYPPRKQTDTSIGDAINWEWIIHCANKSRDNHNILIVSRDGDYGVSYNDDAILNDWLKREFKERVSRQRDIELTTKLTVALKRLDEKVTIEDEKEEKTLIKPSTSDFTLPEVGSKEWDQLIEEVLKDLQADLSNPNSSPSAN